MQFNELQVHYNVMENRATLHVLSLPLGAGYYIAMMATNPALIYLIFAMPHAHFSNI